MRTLYGLAGLALVLGLSVSANAAVLWEVTFDHDGNVAGDPLAVTANSGTVGPAYGQVSYGSGDAGTTTLTYADSHAYGGLAGSWNTNRAKFVFGNDGNTFPAFTSAGALEDDFTFSFSIFTREDLTANYKPFGQYGTNLFFSNKGVYVDGDKHVEVKVGDRILDTAVTTGEWSHVLVTIDRNGGDPDANEAAAYLYLDGSLVASNRSCDNALGWIFTEQVIELGDPGRDGNFLIDDICLETGFLDQAGALAKYNAVMTPEPGAMAIVAVGAHALLARRRRRRSQ